ncbi:MAG: MFS transporter [Pseudomonadota bacterium]
MTTPKMDKRSLAAASSGNILEWYDFTVYGFLAPVIGRAFFPEGDAFATTLSAFAVLAVGYMARPIGSVIFGHVGDRLGRKPALLASVILMGLGSVAISLLPTYAQVGVLAPILLVAIRVLQGIAVAGEYAASGILVVEMAPRYARYRHGAIIALAMMTGCIIGSGVPALVGDLTSEAALNAWAWRVPFALGGVVALVSLVLRATMPETLQAPRSKEDPSPVLIAIKQHWREMVWMVVIIAPFGVGYFIIFVYAASYLTQEMHISTATALNFSTISLVTLAIFIVPTGWLSDRFGARRVLIVNCVLMVLLAIPLWRLMHQPDETLILVGQMGLGILNAAGWAVSIAMLCQLVRPQVRCSTFTLGYNTGAALFGGTTPMVAAYLVHRTGDDMAPAYYLMLTALVAMVVIARLPRWVPGDDHQSERQKRILL